ncbi:MAG: hypothetical protein ACFFEV_06625, partial [Candidatus Thorarchaeota archaeon]
MERDSAVFRRLKGRSKKKPEEEPVSEEPVDTSAAEIIPETAIEKETEEKTPFTEMASDKTTATISRVTPPEKVDVDTEATVDMARKAGISPRTAAEIVPGKVLKRDEEGRVHIKIV